MATTTEIRTTQKRMLFDLLKLKKDNPNAIIHGLDVIIVRLETEMEAEDVAYVEKQMEKI